MECEPWNAIEDVICILEYYFSINLFAELNLQVTLST
jgi:hypothetical protein